MRTSPSSVSSYRYIFSASELASSDSFDEWRRGAATTLPLSVGGGTRWDAFPVPQTIRNLGNYLLSVRLPDWVYEANTRFPSGTNGPPSRNISPLPGLGGATRSVDMLVEEDATFQSAFERIAEESAELARMHNQQMQGNMNWRMPVDAMIRKAFVKYRASTHPAICTPSTCDFICDLPCSMPYSSAPVDVGRVVTADTIVATTLFPTPSMFDLDSQIFEELRVDRERHDSPVVCVPHLIVKYKNGSESGSGQSSSLNDATNEVIFLLCAGAHQRRLLGFERELIFGVACSNGKARAFASYWKDNQIQIVRLYAEDFDLQIMEQACLFFLFLLRIRHHSTSFASQLESASGTTIEQNIRSSERSWKADPTSPPPFGTSWQIPSPTYTRAPSPISPMPRPSSPAWSTTSTDDYSEVDMELDDRPTISHSESAVGSKIPG